MHLGPHSILIEESLLVAEPLDLVRLHGHGQLAGALEVGIHAVALHGLGDAVEILHAQLLKAIDLLRPTALPVLVAVREARLAEAAVASRRCPGDARSLQQHDATVGLALLRPDRRPESGVPAADNREIRPDVACEARVVRALHVVEPERGERGVLQGVVDDGCRGTTALENGGAHQRVPQL